ncbi:MAG: hypothetical protein HFI75_00470 [Lachnospiraceae bacterium]|nr:hypothetical protein [Lachnospiraceae bacterium]
MNDNHTDIGLDQTNHYLPFGNFYNENVYVELSYIDTAPSSGIEQDQVKLYAGTKTLLPARIEEETDNSGRIIKKAYFEMQLPIDEEKLQVEITDQTGHTTGKQPIHAYNENIAHDGLMLEKQKPQISISMSEPDYIRTEKNEDEIWYQSDIPINMEVKDPESGLRSIRVDLNEVTLIDRNMNDEQLKSQPMQEIQVVHEVQLDIHTNQVKIQEDGKYVLQIQVEDHAGNTAQEERIFYIDKDKPEIKHIRILDRNHSEIELDQTNHYLPFGNFYNGNVYVELSYTDAAPSSGIEQDQVKLYAGIKTLLPVWIEEETDSSGRIVKKAYFEMKLPLNEEKLQVEIIDHTGHTTERQSISSYNKNIRNDGLMLEIQKPDIEITVPNPDYINNHNGREELWYKSDIVYTAKVTDSDSGIRSVKVDINGTDVINQKEHARQLKENTYSASTGTQGVIRNSDGFYLMNITAVDNADNVTQTSKQIYTDTDHPRVTAYRFETAGSIEGQGVPAITDQYGYYFQEPARLLVTAEDLVPSSGLWKIEYRLVNVNGETSNGIGECVNNQIAIDLPVDFKGKVYTTAVDHVGNVGSEQSLEGVIQESPQLHRSTSKVQLAKPETDKKDTQGLDLYYTSVPVTLYVEDTFSGIRTIDWRVEAAGDSENNQSGHLDIDGQGELLGDTEWNILNSDKNIRTVLEKTIMVRNNSNTVVVTLEFTDRAGNHSSESIVFSIDTTAPQIQVSYSNNEDDSEHEGYFKEARTAEIRITERNFRAEDVVVTITNSETILPSYGEWTQSRGTGNEDDTVYTMRIEYEADGDYTFDIQYADLAGNQAPGVDYGNSVTPTEFTIDRTLPVISLSYNDDASTSVVDHYYYQKARVAMITIEEHNFDESRAMVTITSKDNNGTDLGNAPAVGGWTTSGDTRTASITFDSEDANYSIAVQYTDMAGNQAAPIEEQMFCVDQNDPAIKITGVEDRHAYNEELIQPTVTFTDVNLDAEKTQIILTGASQGEIMELSGEDSRSADSRTFEFDNIREDDIYTLTANATDKAGRTNSVTCRFSVNRHGFTYELSEETVSINHTYTNVPVDIVVREINVDPLQQDSVIVTLSKDNIPSDLQAGRDYRMEKAGQDGEWSVYTYTIYKENYSEDGNYGIRLYSVDGAENISQNNLEDENKKAEINFHVDKTSPNLSILNLKDGETYPFDSQNASISVGDNTFVKEIQILLNGEVAASYDKNEIKEKADKNENYQIAIANSNQSQNIQVIAVDAAGNQSKAEVTDFYVTTNLWIRFINNKLALYGAITGVVLLAAAIVAVVFLKRKQSYGRQNENPK